MFIFHTTIPQIILYIDSLVVGEVGACNCEVESELCLDVVPSVLSVTVADVVEELDVVVGVPILINASSPIH